MTISDQNDDETDHIIQLGLNLSYNYLVEILLFDILISLTQ